MKTLTWTQYYTGNQQTFLDSENAADLCVIYEDDRYKVSAWKDITLSENYYFSGRDEDFAVVEDKMAGTEFLAYDVTYKELKNL